MKLIIFLLSICFILHSCGQNNDVELKKQLTESNQKITELEKKLNDQLPVRLTADTEEEYAKLISNPNVLIIRSVNDLDKLINEKVDVFSKLDPVTIRVFKKDLQFKDGKLISANYGVIQKKLSRPDYKRFWNRFGFSLDLIADHEGYRCDGAHTCSSSSQHICMGGC
jgi:hypothetical protein